MKRTRLKMKCQFMSDVLTNIHNVNIGRSFFKRAFSKLEMLNYALVVMCFTFILYSCSGRNNHIGFKTCDEAYNVYAQFLNDLKVCDSLSFEEITEKIKDWQVLRDSVYHYIAIDTVTKIHEGFFTQTENITNNIRIELFRLSDKHVVSFTDLIKFNKLCLPNYRYSGFMLHKSYVENFYNQLDSVRIPQYSSKKLIEEYRSFLVSSLEGGFLDRKAVLSFFRNEDLYFRGFLTCFHDFEDLDMTDISRLTEKCCYTILQLSDSENSDFDELKCLMMMRTNRRLLQNAKTCLDNLVNGYKLSKDQASAYLWMTLQPYSTIGPLSINLLTANEERFFYRLSDAMPYILSELNEYLSIEHDNIIYLPKQILKATIYNL